MSLPVMTSLAALDLVGKPAALRALNWALRAFVRRLTSSGTSLNSQHRFVRTQLVQGDWPEHLIFRVRPDGRSRRDSR